MDIKYLILILLLFISCFETADKQIPWKKQSESQRPTTTNDRYLNLNLNSISHQINESCRSFTNTHGSTGRRNFDHLSDAPTVRRPYIQPRTNFYSPQPFERHTYLYSSNKGEKDRNLKNETNSRSTLSLHISCYENARSEIKDSLNENFCSVDESPFEFPRQQQTIDKSDPEVMQFKSSQKLLNPHEASSASENLPTGPMTFDDQLRSAGFVEIERNGDGSCFFHSFIYGLNRIRRSSITSEEVRQNIVTFMRQHPTVYEDFAERNEVSPGILESFDTYLDRMESPDTYVNYIEVQATANLYDIEIIVHEAGISPRSIVPFGSNGDTAERIHVTYNRYLEHYNALIIENEHENLDVEIEAESLTLSQRLMPPPPLTGTFSNPATPSTSFSKLQLIGSSPSPSPRRSTRFSSLKRRSSSDPALKNTKNRRNDPSAEIGVNGICLERQYSYDEQTEAWRWFQETLEVKSQQWEEDNFPHDCYIFISESDLEEILEQLEAGELSDEAMDLILAEIVQYIGETYDLEFRAQQHESSSKFKDQMKAEGWVMISVSPQVRCNTGKAKDTEHVLIMIARFFGLYNTREKGGYGLYNNHPGFSSTGYFSKILAEPSHEFHQLLLDVFRDAIIWGIKFGKKLYLSKRTVTFNQKIAYREANRERLQPYWTQYNAEHLEEKLAYQKQPAVHAKRMDDQRNRRRGVPVLRTPSKDQRCRKCGLKGHRSSNSRVCREHPDYNPQ